MNQPIEYLETIKSKATYKPSKVAYKKADSKCWRYRIRDITFKDSPTLIARSGRTQCTSEGRTKSTDL